MRILGCVTALLVAGTVVAAVPPTAGDRPDPARLQFDVSPSPASPGGELAVRLTLIPAKGIKINKYPKIKLQIPAQDGIAAPSEGSLGATAAPPPDKLDDNYFKSIDPLEVKVTLDAGAKPGAREIEGKVTYFYCVAASGYCAPAKVAVKIPVTVKD